MLGKTYTFPLHSFKTYYNVIGDSKYYRLLKSHNNNWVKTGYFIS